MMSKVQLKHQFSALDGCLDERGAPCTVQSDRNDEDAGFEGSEGAVAG